jgi:hypothetical protein
MTAAFLPLAIRDCRVFRLKPVAPANAHLMIDLKKPLALKPLESYRPPLTPLLPGVDRPSVTGRHIWRGSSRRSGTVGSAIRIAVLTCRGRPDQAP